MSIQKLIESKPLSDVVSISINADTDYLKNGVPFIGSARKHPYRDDKILVAVESSDELKLIEFKNADILHIEEQKLSAGTDTGTAVRLFRFWIKKGSSALTYTPFTVE